MYLSLRTAKQFETVFRLGSRRSSGGLLVVQTPGPEGPPRVGFVVGRKVGGAVDRNRAKRRLREAVKLVPLTDGTDYVVVASAAVVDAPFERLQKWLMEAISKKEAEA